MIKKVSHVKHKYQQYVLYRKLSASNSRPIGLGGLGTIMNTVYYYNPKKKKPYDC